MEETASERWRQLFRTARSKAGKRIAAFEYDELQAEHVRLLQIERSSNIILAVQLRQFHLNDCPSFFALSYVCGTLKATEQILVNNAPFWVTPTLWQALRTFRDSHIGSREEWVWIDAICISQSDLSEKSRSIRVMDQIYSKAEAVLIFLRHSYAESLLAERTLCWIHNHKAWESKRN